MLDIKIVKSISISLQALLFVLCAGCVVLALVPSAKVYAVQQKFLSGSHGDRTIMPKSCRACHRGMNIALSGEEDSCLPCHGDATSRQNMIDRGGLKADGDYVLADISVELRKPYSHPVLERSGIHRNLETLPENIINAARHSECVDCHDPHAVDKDQPYRGLKGRREGNFIADITEEYQLCYRCHAESANLPGASSDKHAEFKVTNPSFHPVEGEGRNTNVISLLEPYAEEKKEPGDVSRITCGDCHGSDDATAPKGPHGSMYPGLLVMNYQMADEFPESNYAYELCYKCHDRTSILNDESFPFHSLHIQGRMTGMNGTTCFTCHDAHGSTQYQFLIRFNEDVVTENSAGDLKFEARGVASGQGECFLSCHGVDHNPKSY